MKKLLIFCLVFGQFVGCKNSQQQDQILSETEMIQWLIDIHLAEARLSTNGKDRDVNYQYFKVIEEKLFHKHGATDSTIMKSYQYYLMHSEQLQRIYEAVIDSLNLKEQRLRIENPLEVQ